MTEPNKQPDETPEDTVVTELDSDEREQDEQATSGGDDGWKKKYKKLKTNHSALLARVEKLEARIAEPTAPPLDAGASGESDPQPEKEPEPEKETPAQKKRRLSFSTSTRRKR